MEKVFENFSYLMQTEIVFGKDTELKTAELIKKYGGTKVMIVMDGGGFVKASGLFDRVANNLKEAGIPFVELEGVQPNPRLTLALKGIDICRAEGVDFLLAIGGGSTIDTAKTIALQLTYDGDVMDFYTGSVPETMMPVGAIATIAATGSETSGSAVIYDDIERHTKLGNMFNHIRCKFAICNPEITYTLPAFQTGAGAADMLCHAFDSYFMFSNTYMGDQFSEACMRCAVKYGPLAIKDPTNYEYRAELLLCSEFAHNDTCRIGRDTAFYKISGGTHALETHMTAVFDTAHGAGLSVLMPAILQNAIDNDETTVYKVAQFANRVFDVEIDPFDLKVTAQRGIDRFRDWLKSLGMPTTLTELARREITDADIENIISPFKGCAYAPMFGHFQEADIKRLFESVRK